MPAYRFYLLDAQGHIIESRDVACDDDRCAEELARGMVAEAHHVHAIEAWLRPRIVCRVDNGGAAAAPVRGRR